MTNLTIAALQQAYANGEVTPAKVVAQIRSRSQEVAQHPIWIHLLSAAELQPYLDALEHKPRASHPLWGIPFAIKDNIDLAGIPTTAACADFAYRPERSATVVERLIAAGAIPLGKTNLDQFATGLNGTRSPYGACRNAFNADYISGGSSSGSAVAVALGLASFSLGTDTAGSGRVPAAFNNLIGLKPSRGLLPNTGVVRACRSLDCISIFGLTTDDANSVLAVAEGVDDNDEYSRASPFANRSRHYGTVKGALTVGLLPESQLEFFGDQHYAAAYHQTLQCLQTQQNLTIDWVEIDYAPFQQAARLLYEGPWVSERYLATLPLIKDHPGAMQDVVRQIIEPGGALLATDAFSSQYRLLALQKQCLAQLQGLDCLLTPTAGRCFTIDELLQAPIEANSQLGYYTNFVNLLDLCALALPSAFTEDGMPFGVTLVADHFNDRKLLSIANALQQHLQLPLGKSGNTLPASACHSPVDLSTHIEVAVCGAHLAGLPLNWQLTERGGVLLEKTVTADGYRLYALAGGPPYRPALVYDGAEGSRIEVEVWKMPVSEFGSFVAGIPAPLGIGKVTLWDGRQLCSFICEPYGIEDAVEITGLGGWRKYLAMSHSNE